MGRHWGTASIATLTISAATSVADVKVNGISTPFNQPPPRDLDA